MSFLIKLTKEQERKIARDILVSSYREGKYIINDNNLNDVMEILGIKTYETKATEFEGIVEIHKTVKGKSTKTTPAKKDKENLIVTIKEDQGQWGSAGLKNLFKCETERLLPVVKKPIILTIPHGNPTRDKAGAFHIGIWTTAKARAKRCFTPPTHIWNIPVSCNDTAYSFSGIGIDIKFENYSVAELTDNHLYIHHDICNDGCEEEIDLYRILISKVIDILREQSGDQGDINVCFENLVSDQVYSKSYYEEQITSLENSAAINLSKYQKDRENIEHLRNILNVVHQSFLSLKNKFKEETKIIASNPKVTDITVNREGIIIRIKDIRAKGPKGIHTLGQFKIILCLNGKIKVFNETKKIKGQSAPNVNEFGDLPIGRMTNIFPQLIGKLDLNAALNIVINALETSGDEAINGALANNISAWPLAKGI